MERADSVYLGYRGGPKAAHSITLSGTARPGSNIAWMFEQLIVRGPNRLDNGSLSARICANRLLIENLSQ